MFGSMGQSAIKNLGNGGEMDGDVTITGDLAVQGGISLSVDEVIQGTSTIDINDTEALLVRKNGDGGDVFIVDTTNSHVGIGSAIVSYTDAITTSQTLSIGENQDSSDKLASVQIIGRGSGSTDTVGALEFINTRGGSGVVSSIVGGRFNGGSASDGSLSFNTKNGSSLTTKMTINDVGNIGIGNASPIATHSAVTQLTLGGNSLISFHTATGASGALRIGQNSYLSYSGNTTYVSEDQASMYTQEHGTHLFQVVGVGTGNIDSNFTDSLLLDNSGNATFAGNVNMTADKFLNVGGAVSKNSNVGSTAHGITIQDANAPTLSLYATGNAGYHSHFFQISNNAFIRSSGNLTMQTNAGTVALTLDSSQNATFAGDVDISGGASINGGSSQGAYNFKYQSASTSRAFRITSEHSAYADFAIQKETDKDGGSYENLLYFTSAGDAYFDNDVIVSGGDLGLSKSTGSRLMLERTDTEIVNGDLYGNIEFRGTDNSGGGNSDGVRAEIRVESDGTGTQGETSMIFKTSHTATTQNIERVRINNLGNVGIGTSSPVTMLNLKGDGTSIITLETSDTTQEVNNLTGAIYFRGNDATSGAGGTRAMIKANAQDSSGGHYMSFATAPSAGTVAERVRIDMDGNVGIGTATTNWTGLGIDHTVLSVGNPSAGMGMLELSGKRTSTAELGRLIWGMTLLESLK